MKTLNIHNETNINANGTRTQRNCKPVICIDTGEVFSSVTDAAEHFGSTVYSISNCVRGVQKTAQGKRFCFLSKATENLGELTSQIAQLSEDARRWREYQAAQDAIRREEEERRLAEQRRLEAIERARREHEERIAKVTTKLDHRNRAVERLEAELRRAIERRNEIERELNELNREEDVA
jgi:predicted RNase H-like nuclease (RuvC/YqgF family)